MKRRGRDNLDIGDSHITQINGFLRERLQSFFCMNLIYRVFAKTPGGHPRRQAEQIVK